MKEIYLDESEEKLTVDEIQSFEKKIGKIFPNDFKKFLLKSNGGYPREELFTHPFIEINPNTNIEFVQETDVEKFFSLNEIDFIFTISRIVLSLIAFRANIAISYGVV